MTHQKKSHRHVYQNKENKFHYTHFFCSLLSWQVVAPFVEPLDKPGMKQNHNNAQGHYNMELPPKPVTIIK